MTIKATQEYLCSVMGPNFGIDYRDIEARAPVEALVEMVRSAPGLVVRAIVDEGRVDVPEEKVTHDSDEAKGHVIYESDSEGIQRTDSLAVYSSPLDELRFNDEQWERYAHDDDEFDGEFYVRR